MRKIIFIILFLVMAICAYGGYISKSDTVELMAETMYLDGKMGVTDSISVKVLHGGSVVYDSIFTSADGWCYSVSTPDGNALVFSAPFDSIDGGNGDGCYKIITWAIYGSSELRTPGESGCYRVGSPNVNIASVDADAIEAGDFDTGAINADALATDAINEIEDAVHANANDYKADVSGLSTFDASSDSVMTKNPNAYKADVSGLSTFDATSDSVMTKNPDAYKADISGLSTFDPAIDLVNIDTSDCTIIADSVKTYVGVDSSRTALGDSLRTALGDSCTGGGSGSDTTAIKQMMNNNYWGWHVAYNSTFPYGSIGDSLFDPGPSFISKIDSALASIGYDGSYDLHTKIDNLSLSGGGTEPETLVVGYTQEGFFYPIEGARVTVRTIDGTTTKVPGLRTDVNGRRILELDPDSFYVALTANNYVQKIDTLIVETGGGKDTLYMSPFDPGQPADPSLCRVYGWVYDISGDNLSGIEVTAEIPRDYHPVKYSGIVITPFSRS
ncbi:MAG: hypothetical protein DRP26_06325, partial [Candidatus Zixiibacteriota bacterium]